MRLPIPPPGRDRTAQKTTINDYTDSLSDKRTPLPRARRTSSRPPTREPAPPRRRDDFDPALLPSRDAILQALAAAGTPLPRADLIAVLQAPPIVHDALAGRLAAMERDGQILTNRKGELGIVARLGLIIGIIEGHPDGFGFLVPEDGGDDVFLSPREMHRVLHGDRAMVRVVGFDRKGRREGEIVEVLARANTTVVGRLHVERGVHFIEALNRHISQDFLVPADGLASADVGAIVVATIVEQPTGEREAVARVTEVLGAATDPGIEIEIALRKHALPFTFSAEAQRQAKRLPVEVRPADRKGRRDLTTLPLVTIDGETARDFDDAVYCERKGHGWRLVVAIADVAHYVRDGHAIDRDARERGTSVYFPRRVIPMLPASLSDELCSLKPGVDRVCMACDIDVSAQGGIEAYAFYPAVIHSHARLTYTQVASWLDEAGKATTPQAKALLPHLRNLHALYAAFARARRQRGAIDFDTEEPAIEFDDNGKIARIVPAPRNDAHKLIEECMLAANVCAAHYLLREKQGALFRVHEPPPPDKLAALREFLALSALHLGGGEKPTAADYAKLLAVVGARSDRDLMETVLLRSLAQARYQPDNAGHFGLGYDAYAHFTSPIRRYPDLLVHRGIKAALAGTRYTPTGMTWSQLGVHTSMTERRADEATRDVVNWLKCHYMRERIGEEFDGTVSGVTSFGVFVTLDELAIDGLVHVTELGRDYFHFDAVRHALVGEHSGVTYQLAGRLRVKVARVDMEQTKIDFVLADRVVASGTPTATAGGGPPARPVFAEPLAAGDAKRKPARQGKGRRD